MKNPLHVGKTLGPYTPAIEVPCGSTKMLFVSGQIGIDPVSSGLVSSEFEKQARQAFINLGNILEKGGYSFKDVVKITLFLQDLADFQMMNSLCQEYFSEPFPARSTIQVAALPKGALVEIEAIAVKEN